jgi:hypothetical protein
MVQSKAILVLLSGLVFTMVGCQAISYKPSVTLNHSPKTIKARVSISKFVDQTPSEDRDSKVFGVSFTEPGTLEVDLATGVTNAILSDFRDNRVFDVIEKNLDNADLIIKGRIQRFSGKGWINALGWLTLPINFIWLLGLPVQSVDADVQIEMVVVRPDGTEAGSYTGRSQFSELFSLYTQRHLATPRYTNTAFAKAVDQIRQKLLADESKLTKR